MSLRPASRRFLLTVVVVAVAVFGAGCPPQQDIAQPQTGQLAALPVATGPELDAYTISPQPEWTDKYVLSDPGADIRYFRMKKLMTDFGLSRFQAVELQNHYRDLTRTGVPPAQAFGDALTAIKAGRTGSGVDLNKLQTAPFIVVFDLDETLFQRSPSYHNGNRGPGWSDFSIQAHNEESYIKLRPGWEKALRRVRELGGMVILFTASPDGIAEAVASKWMTGGTNIMQLVDGILSKSHLILQDKNEGDPVVLPSKDLRAFDESLDRVIIVDDNPKLILQHNRQRLVKKFQADQYLAAKYEKHGLTAPFEQTLPVVMKEIEESLQYGKANHVPLGPAFLPYTMLGQVAMEALTQSGMKPEAARLYIRQNPGFVDEKF